VKTPTIITNPDKYKKGWIGGLPETPCGFGSKFAQTRIQRDWIPKMVAKYAITSIADIGAGDLNWASRTAFGCDYTPYDLIPRARGVRKFNLLIDELPAADCLMVLWVINHFPVTAAKIAMEKLLNGKSRYLIMTWDSRMWDFTDVQPVEREVLRCSRDTDFEIRLVEL